VPEHLRLSALRSQAGRYDPALLDAFAELLGPET
jgi:hypothetical protein